MFGFTLHILSLDYVEENDDEEEVISTANSNTSTIV